MPTPGHEPFLRAICADPEDDTVRLVYADWLDENGDPDRAEFVRLQIRRAQLKAGGENPKELKDRDVHLRRLHEERWRRELPLEVHPETWQRFWRGFVSGVTVDARYFINRADVLFAAAPVQFVHVRRLTDDRVALFGASVHLRRLHGLALSEDRLGTGWYRLFGAGNLVNLRWLEVRSDVHMSAEAARLLAALPKIDRVDIRGAVPRKVATVLSDRFGPNARWRRAWP